MIFITLKFNLLLISLLLINQKTSIIESNILIKLCPNLQNINKHLILIIM